MKRITRKIKNSQARQFWTRLPLIWKVFIAGSGLALIVTIISSIILYREACDLRMEQHREGLMAVAAIAARQIDTENLKSIEQDNNTSQYWEVMASLAAIREANPDICRIYTLHKDKSVNSWRYVLDSSTSPGLKSSTNRTINNLDKELIRRSLTQPVASKQPKEDSRGTILTAYAPIRDSNGHVVAVLGIDLSLGQLVEQRAVMQRAAIASIAIAFLLAVILSFIVTKSMLRPVKTLTRAAQKVRGGDFNFQIALSQSDELNELAQTFNRMVSELKQSHEKLMEQNSRDFLTGLLNHRAFLQKLKAEIERASRYNHSVCLLAMDLDRFKTINDTMGHPIGDSILYQLSSVLNEHIRAIDAAGRCGGDEFAIMLPETDLETGQAVAERIRRKVESHCFYAVPLEELKSPDFKPDEKKIIHPTATIGVAGFPQDDQSASGLVMAADVALFRAKRISRNRVCVYSAETGENESHDPNKLYKMLRQKNSEPAQIQSVLADARSKYTRSHAESVTAYAMAIGKALGVDRETLDGIKIAGLLHDLGKIGMPESILNKPGSLTREEQETVKLHPVIGGRILNGLLQNESVVPAIISHHERWDGAGYPNGLAGEDIPLMARILAVADAFDAMTSDRPYRKAMSTQDALIELRANAGKQFDPRIVDACISRPSSDTPQIAIAEDNKNEATHSAPVESATIIDVVKLSADNKK